MKRWVCIHGHFYQPPRENPWLESVERQDSAYPYHDWNERITAECYGPNAHARILDNEERIAQIVNNYSRINFDFGPTLLSWLEAESPDVYAAIIESQRESRRRFHGHGSAMAQAYSHSILPLASLRDKRTEVRWGIRDFTRRFGGPPAGMWLPEAAADSQTLEVLAEEGIRFTVLAPHQAQRVRKLGTRAWRDISGGRVDPKMPYLVRLPSGRTLCVFFYDGPISRAVAFEGLLQRGDHLAERLKGAFDPRLGYAQLVNIATDGESYGHHHRFGEMALAYALQIVESTRGMRLTNYAEFLERHPPTHEARIAERSSWSCAHGVERWRSDCGCHTGGLPAWNQAWRAPLRDSLYWLRDRLAQTYGRNASRLLKDPWACRDEYIQVILDRSEKNVDAFLWAHAAGELSPEEKTSALKLLELQRHSLLMFTSCGWFFNDLAGIETVQILRYAARALQLDRELTGEDVEPAFLDRLALAKSNDPAKGDGRRLYEAEVKTAVVDMAKVGAHYGVSSLFEDFGDEVRVHGFRVRSKDARLLSSGKAKLSVGHVEIRSELTRETAEVSYSFIHLGDHNINGGARLFQGARAYESMREEITGHFNRADLTAVIRMLDKRFPESVYSLRSLFKDDQRRIVERILESTVAETEAFYTRLCEQRAGLMRFLADIGVPQPQAFRTAAEFTLNTRIRRCLDADSPDFGEIGPLLEEVRRSGVKLDNEGVGYALERVMERLSRGLASGPDGTESLERLEKAVALARELDSGVDLWKVQNAYYAAVKKDLGLQRDLAKGGDRTAKAWVERFESLGERLSMRVDEEP